MLNRRGAHATIRVRIQPGTRSEQKPQEQQLIEQAIQGDQAAFAALYQAHKRRVYSLCLRMTHSTTEAEDLTQDAFLQVFRKLHTFRGESSFSTWLHRLTANVVLMRFRKRTLAEVPLEPPDGDDEQSARPEFGNEDLSLTGSIDRMSLTRAIEELPPGYRLAFLLHDVYGYEHQEIASILGCTTGNCKSQLHKARLRLRELLTPKRFSLKRGEVRELREYSNEDARAA